MSNFSVFAALDLEMEQPSNEIIQIGVSFIFRGPLGDRYIKENFYVTPTEPLSEFIKNLCGISESDFDRTKTRKQCFQEFVDYMNEMYKTHPDMFHEFVVWGQGDVSTLYTQMESEDVFLGGVSGRRSLDVKSLIQYRGLVNNTKVARKMSLKSAVYKHKLEFSGSSHQAADDAYNTLKLFIKLLDEDSVIASCNNIVAKYRNNI